MISADSPIHLVSQARLSLRRRESGQIPIIISFLIRQEFLGVLIDEWRRTVAFFGMLFKQQGLITEDLPLQNTSQFMFTPTSLNALLLSMQYKSLMGI